MAPTPLWNQAEKWPQAVMHMRQAQAAGILNPPSNPCVNVSSDLLSTALPAEHPLTTYALLNFSAQSVSSKHAAACVKRVCHSVHACLSSCSLSLYLSIYLSIYIYISIYTHMPPSLSLSRNARDQGTEPIKRGGQHRPNLRSKAGVSEEHKALTPLHLKPSHLKIVFSSARCCLDIALPLEMPWEYQQHVTFHAKIHREVQFSDVRL